MLNFTLTVGRKTHSLRTTLDGVGGFTGRGKVRFSSWRSGARYLDVALKGVAGANADVHLNDEKFAQIPLKSGNAHFSITTSCGGNIPDLLDGAAVEIRQNGQPILSGVLHEAKPGLLDFPRLVFYSFR